MRKTLGRFVQGKGGSSFLRPVHGSRHISSQMKFFSGGKFKVQAKNALGRLRSH